MQEKRKVLIIDSDVNLLEDLQRRFMLEPDFEVFIASTGMDGFNKVRQLVPQFVVINSLLPDMDVLQFISSLNMMYPQIQKIITMEVENPMLLAQYMQSGAQYVITKPYSVDKLIEVINSLAKKTGINNGIGNVPPPNTAPTVNNWQQNQFPFQQGQGFGAPSQGFSFDQFKNAMQQFSQQQGQQGGVGFTPQTGMPGNGFSAPGGGYSFPQFNQSIPYSPNNINIDMTGIEVNPNSIQPQQQQGGVRTLKQTIIAVYCPKGGVGKTTVSKELALAFATATVNGQPLKVCLVDCDLDFGDVASMLKLNSYPNITHWTTDIAQRLQQSPNSKTIRYPQQLIESKFLITHHTGLKVLAAPSNHSDALDITGQEMEIVIDNLKACDYDVIILDTGNNTKDFTLIALDKANVILIVTTLDVAAINDTNMLLNTLRTIQFPMNKIQLVINRVPKADRDIDINEISQVLRIPIIGTIPEYPKIRLLNNSGASAILDSKENEYSMAIRQIGHKIVPVFNKAIRTKTAQKKQKSFFTKLFGR